MAMFVLFVVFSKQQKKKKEKKTTRPVTIFIRKRVVFEIGV